MKRVGVLLSGCGVYDGSDVQETVLVLLALARRGLRALPIAPEMEQRDVADHATGHADEDAAPRRVLSEAARITRGQLRDLAQVVPAELDALVIPGGIGAVRQLCQPAVGAALGGPLREDVAALLTALSAKRVPIALLGLARVLADRLDEVPIDPGAMGIGAEEILVDEARARIFSPGFMASDSIVSVAKGIDRLVEELARRLGCLAVLPSAGAASAAPGGSAP